MAGQSKDIGIGDARLDGGQLIGGPLGGPGREGKRLVTPMQASGDYTGPGNPHDPMRNATSQRRGGAKNNPSSGAK